MPHPHTLALAAAVLLVLPGSSLGTRPAAAEPATPVVEGPVTGGLGQPFVAATTFDLAEVGYTQAEFFLSGTARSYLPAEPLASDGRWLVEPDQTAEYRTRILVFRPEKRRRFSGTVVVEWLNVSGGLDSAPDWLLTHTELIRRGHAWVGVSAQAVGVEGGPALPGLPSMPLKEVDPERYGSLVHPGDSFSYDIFSQVGQALRRARHPSPLGRLRPRRVLAVGESQSAFRLTTYANAIHPRDGVYDGYFIHSRGASSAALAQPPEAIALAPPQVFHRTDLDVPVLTFQTETDLVTLLNYARDRQPDSEHFRLWEVAGTAHADIYTTSVGATDRGGDPAVTELVVTTMPVAEVPSLVCPVPINSGPQHFVAKAALAALERWVRTGRAPAPRPRLELAQPPPQAVIARDELGNALGGIRTPAVDVPIATLSGEGQSGSILCILFGTTVPFDEETLAALYPDACEYLREHDRATLRALFRGDLLLPDAGLLLRGARLFGPGADAECRRGKGGRHHRGWGHRHHRGGGRGRR